MKIVPREISLAWKRELSDTKFVATFVVSAALLVLSLHFFTRFLEWVEGREGVVLHDPFLMMMAPRDFTWLTFGLIYAAVIIAIVHLVPQPKRLLFTIQLYTLMVVVRVVMMWLVPLNPPEGLIVLRDPIVQLLGNGEAPTKDLFFSGHTATMFLFYLVATNRVLKAMFLVFTLLVAVFVIWQHVHYTIDVAVAPLVAYGAFRCVGTFSRQ